MQIAEVRAVRSQASPQHRSGHYNTIFKGCFVKRPLCGPTEILLRCRRPYCVAMATIRRIICALSKRRCHGVCFEHGQSARRQSAFYAITPFGGSLPAMSWCNLSSFKAMFSSIAVIRKTYILEDFENASPYFCAFLANRICDRKVIRRI